MRAPLDCELEPERFALHVLRVPRPRLHDAELELGRVRSGDEAWELLCLRGYVPDALYDDPGRRFFGPRGLGAAPPDARCALAFAADLDGARTAEALALELCARLRSFGPTPAGLVRWRFVDPRWQARPTPASTALREAVFAAQLALLERSVAEAPAALVSTLLRSSNASAKEARYDARRAALWAQARAHDAALAGLADPFAPALALWGLGYGVEDLDAEGVTLAAPLP